MLKSIKKKFPYYIFSPYKDENRGICFFSKSKIKEHTLKKFSHSNRNITNVEFSNYTLSLTHLKHDWVEPKKTILKKIRIFISNIFSNNTLPALQANEIKPLNKPRIIVGDFNAFSNFLFFDSKAISILKKEFKISNYNGYSWPNDKIKFLTNYPKLKIDNCFYEKIDNISTKILNWDGSDHYPLLI